MINSISNTLTFFSREWAITSMQPIWSNSKAGRQTTLVCLVTNRSYKTPPKHFHHNANAIVSSVSIRSPRISHPSQWTLYKFYRDFACICVPDTKPYCRISVCDHHRLIAPNSMLCNLWWWPIQLSHHQYYLSVIL